MRSKHLRVLYVMLLTWMPLSAQAFDVSRDALEGGGNLLTLHDDSVPVVNVRITFEGAGAAADSFGARGLAYMASQMLMEGTKEKTADAFQEALAEHAISMSASVDEDHFTLSITTLREHLPVAIDLAKEALLSPRLATEDLERVRVRTISRLARLSEQPAYRADRLLMSRLFEDHPYANPAMGTPEDLARLEPQDITAFIQTYLTAGNVVVAVAGDAETSDVETLLEPLLSGLEQNDMGPVPVARASLEHAGSTVKETMAVPQTVIAFALPWVARSDDNFYASYLLHMVLGGQGLSSLLMQNLREESGLVYGVSTQLNLARGASLLIGHAATRNESADEVMERTARLLKELQEKGVPSSACENAKTYLLGAMQLELDNTAAQVEMLRMMQLFDLPENYLDKRIRAVEATSCADVNRVAASLLNPANLTFAVVGGSPASGEAAAP